MSKIVKNTTGTLVEIQDVGLSVPALGQISISPIDFDLFSASDDIITLVGNGTLVINNGAEDLAKSDAIRLIQGGFSNKTQLDDDILDNNRVKVDVTGTLSDGRVKVSTNDTTTGFLDQKIASADNKIDISITNAGNDEDLLISFNPSNVGTSELNNDANFIDASGAPVQPSDIANFETTTQLNVRDTNNRNRVNHTGTQTASTISDFNSAVQSAETTTSISFNNATNTISFTDESGVVTDLDLSQFLDDTNLSRIVSGSLDAQTGIVTFTRDDATTFTVDFSPLLNQGGVDIHEQTINNHDDVNIVSPSNGQVLTYNGSVWEAQTPSGGGTSFTDFVRDDVGRVNNTTTFDPYLVLSTTLPETGNYKISWSYTWSLDNIQNDFVSRVQIDNTTTILEHQQEPKDSGGNGPTLPETGGGTEPTGTNQKHPTCGFDIINLTSGAHTIELDFACSSVGTRAVIYRGILAIERWD